MSPVLLETSVLPLHGQIAVQDVGATDLPEWQTGEERVASTSRSILIATQPDRDGDVTIKVVAGEARAEAGDRVFDGQLVLTGTEIEVGNALAGSLHRVDVGQKGPVRLRIFVDPPDRPAVIVIVVG